MSDPGTILGDVDGITLGFDISKLLDSVDGSFGGSNDGKIVLLFSVDSLGYTYGKAIGTILGNVDGITLGIDVETDLGSLDGSFGNIYSLIWWTKPFWIHLIFVSDPYLIYVGYPCSNLGNIASFRNNRAHM